MPDADIARIRSWADGQIALIWGHPDPAEQIRLAQGLLEFWHYCEDLVRQRVDSGHRGDDFISRALDYRDDDDAVLTVPEVASLAFNLLVAGHETTAGLLAHALDQALSAPQRWSAIVADPDIVPAFVGETLRFAPAIDGWLRVTSRDVTLGAVTIPAGARCLLLIGAANRDPAAFAQPDGSTRTGRMRETICHSATVRISASVRDWHGWKPGQPSPDSPRPFPASDWRPGSIGPTNPTSRFAPITHLATIDVTASADGAPERGGTTAEVHAA
ncbi:cytochrome P450 [Micromonospora sp. M12]